MIDWEIAPSRDEGILGSDVSAQNGMTARRTALVNANTNNNQPGDVQTTNTTTIHHLPGYTVDEEDTEKAKKQGQAGNKDEENTAHGGSTDTSD